MLEAPSAWDRVLRARNAARPHALDYIGDMIDGFVELHGDRHFGDDHALVGGIGGFRGRSVIVIGHQKGGNTRENLERNFGMPRPEGYRKALRLMRQAEKFDMPVISLVDTPAADPGLGSEERGQSVAIAENLLAMASLRVPTVAIVIGEGGSGGALAISVADRLLMLENAIYAVASPEACATILWRDVARAPEAAAALRLTAADLFEFGIVDEVIPEPVSADQEPGPVMRRVADALERHLAELEVGQHRDGVDALLARRYAKYRRIGRWQEVLPAGIAANGAELLAPE
ncbi:MAG TPA: acetyl-CoA carboxylase carboxyltransferase subunit alpha [Thermomicrobiaceae bacterium]|nr:acetyl-CoA carboxylase carboxyltransferase subunit alpha [Thermomicrobiaceae bacterium]